MAWFVSDQKNQIAFVTEKEMFPIDGEHFLLDRDCLPNYYYEVTMSQRQSFSDDLSAGHIHILELYF